ncbi:MAG TPA: acyltransferase [Acidimicrobiia bacterium]
MEQAVDRGPAARRSRRLAGFDGLRGLAALGVLVLHATDVALIAHPGAHDFTAQLQSGVQIFFVLSAFLLARPFVRAVLTRRPLPGVRAYARSRLLRIIPAYWVALVGSTVFLGTTDMHSAKDWLVQLTLTQVYSIGQFARGISVAWTLSVEVTFYLLLPFFFMAVAACTKRLSPIAALASGTAVLFVGGAGFMLWTASGNRFLPSLWLPFYLPVFALGIALAIVREAVVDPRRRQAAGTFACRTAVLWWAAAAAVLAFAAIRYGRLVLIPYRAHLLGSQVAYGVYALLLVVPLVLDFEGVSVVTRLLERRVVVFLGLVSYPLYLWHNQITTAVREHWLHLGNAPGNALEQLAIVLAVTLVVASVSWFALERPIIEYGRRLGSRRRIAASAVERPPEAAATAAGFRHDAAS